MIPLSLEEIIAQMQDDARQEYGEEFHVSESSDWYRENVPVAIAIKLMYDKMLDVESNMSLRTASDPYFFLFASNYLFQRKMPTRAIGIATTNDSVIGATARVGEIKLRKKGTDITYSNTEALKITSLPFSFEIASNQTGSITNALENEVIEIISVPANWRTFTNKQIQGGQDLETLEEARKRFFNNGVSQAYWNVDGVKAELLRIDGVKSAWVRANPNDTSIESQTRRSIWCVVDGGRDEDIAKAIFKKFTDATLTIGSQTVKVKDKSNNEVEIHFDRPSEINIDIKVSVLGQDKPELKEYIKEYLTLVAVGGIISGTQAQKYIPGYLEYEGLDITFKKQGTSNFVTYIQLGNTEKAKYGVV